VFAEVDIEVSGGHEARQVGAYTVVAVIVVVVVAGQALALAH
jgi:hypothetical protein